MTSKIRISPELEQLRRLVAGARLRLAELEVEFAREKARVEAAQAVLFRHLRGRNQKRDRLRLAVHYRQKFLDSFVRDDPDEAEQAERDLAQAKARLDEDYETLAAAAEAARPMTAEQEVELGRHWRKLVVLHQPDRFTREPDKLATFHKLAGAIHRAKESGDLPALREIAEDTQGFMLRQGWTELDFNDAEEPAELARLRKTLQAEIATVTESLKALRGSPDYELCRLAEQKPGRLEELAAERLRQVEAENAELELQAERLAEAITKLGGKAW
jgi:hypothetical protein